jgi:uncharacterized membrane protein (DUF485 family)
MNVFTTDHPMVSQPSWADAKAHRRLSALGDALALAVVLTPFAVVLLFCLLVEDDAYVYTTPSLPSDVGWGLAMGAVLAFVASYVCALLIVLGYRFVAGK